MLIVIDKLFANVADNAWFSDRVEFEGRKY